MTYGRTSKNVRAVVAVVLGIWVVFSCLVCGFATETYVPDNDISLSGETHYNPSGESEAPSSSPSESHGGSSGSDDLFDTGDVKDYAGGLFDFSEFEVEKGSDNKVVRALNSKAMWLISIVCGIFPALVLFHFAVDILCMLSPTVRQFFATRKHQFFSDEVAKNFGFSLQSGGQQQGYAGGAVQPPPATAAVGQPNQNGQSSPIMGYIQARLWLIIVCLLLMVLCGSGQLFRILSWIVNLAIHLMTSFIS